MKVAKYVSSVVIVTSQWYLLFKKNKQTKTTPYTRCTCKIRLLVLLDSLIGVLNESDVTALLWLLHRKEQEQKALRNT